MSLWKKPADTGTVDSNRAFKYLWFNWSVVGINPTKSRRRLYICYGIFINLLFSVFLPISMFINLRYIKSLQLIIANLSLSFSFGFSALKQFMLLYFRSKLKAAGTHLPPLDKRCNQNAADRAHILNAIYNANRFYLFFMNYFNITVLGFMAIAARNHLPIYNGWFPKFSESADVNYWLTFVYHFLGQSYAVFQNANNDSYPLCYLGMLIGHLRALAGRLERIGWDDKLTMEDNRKELLLCIQDHKNILNFFACIRPVISATLFLQFLITGFILCLTGINFLAFNQDTSQMLSNAIYLVAVLMESFPCCYFMNILSVECEYLTTAIYKSNWYKQNLKFRKIMIIFMQRTQRVSIIMAGNLAPITIQTFVSILKFSFSMYTILSKLKIN